MREESSIDSRGQDNLRYAARRAELRRKAKEAARTRDRQAAAASQNEAEGERRDRGRSDKGRIDESGTTARWHEGCSEKRRETAKRDRKRRTPKGGRRLAHHTPLLKSLCGGGVPSSHPSLGLSVFFLSPLSCQCAVREACILRILSFSRQARHRCELARASTITGTPERKQKERKQRRQGRDQGD